MFDLFFNLSLMCTLSEVVIIPICVAYLLVNKFDTKMVFFRFCNRIFNVKDEDL